MRFKQFILEATKAPEKPKEYSEKELKARQDKKTKSIKTLSKSIRSLKSKVTSDLKNESDKTQLTALAIALINTTKERVGSENSANGIGKDENGDTVKKEPHHGVTGLKTNHISFGSGNATLDYIAKSGVKQNKVIKDANIVSLLKKYKKQNKSGFLFVTDNGLKIKANHVNDYLRNFDVTAKDLRAFGGNYEMIKLLNGRAVPKEEADRKKQFLELADKIAEQLGHSRTMLRNSYLLPDLEENYITKGKVLSFSDI